MQVALVTVLLVLAAVRAVPNKASSKIDREVHAIFEGIREEASLIVKDLAVELNHWLDQEFTNTTVDLSDRLETADSVLSLLPSKMEILRRGIIAKIIIEQAKDTKYAHMLGYHPKEWHHTVSGIERAVEGVFVRLASAMERIHDKKFLVDAFAGATEKVGEYYRACQRETYLTIWAAGHGIANPRVRRRARLEFKARNSNVTIVEDNQGSGEEEIE
ncbi:Hypp8056 [Branchiostoma lanceolatum]|nr:Hypp8056 [Branchiostoma lanceolatum]